MQNVIVFLTIMMREFAWCADASKIQSLDVQETTISHNDTTFEKEFGIYLPLPGLVSTSCATSDLCCKSQCLPGDTCIPNAPPEGICMTGAGPDAGTPCWNTERCRDCLYFNCVAPAPTPDNVICVPAPTVQICPLLP